MNKYEECRQDFGMSVADSLWTQIRYAAKFTMWSVACFPNSVPIVAGGMQWFKHPANFSESPTMKHIERMGGLEAVAVAYRLLEFMAGRHGDENGFEGYLAMTPPNTKSMLAEKLVGFVESDYGGEQPAGERDLEKYLDMFEVSGLIERGEIETDGTTLKEGKRVPARLKWETIKLLKLVDHWADTYTTRKKGKKFD